MSNGCPSSNNNNIGEWDQFEANKELFDVKVAVPFDENIYTTELEAAQLDDEKMVAEAVRIADEIENDKNNNTRRRRP